MFLFRVPTQAPRTYLPHRRANQMRTRRGRKAQRAESIHSKCECLGGECTETITFVHGGCGEPINGCMKVSVQL
jgi:hypothetical protein